MKTIFRIENNDGDGFYNCDVNNGKLSGLIYDIIIDHNDNNHPCARIDFRYNVSKNEKNYYAFSSIDLMKVWFGEYIFKLMSNDINRELYVCEYIVDEKYILESKSKKQIAFKKHKSKLVNKTPISEYKLFLD